MDPRSPSWRPDPTGQRLAMIQQARRGGLVAAMLFAPVGLVGLATLPAIDALGRPGAMALVCLAALAGVALLGAGLAPAAIGSRIDGLVVGVALGIGVPVAAVTSVVIGTFLAGSSLDGFDHGARLAGEVLRGGVGGALRMAPLIGVASAAWVIAVRRLALDRRLHPEDAKPGLGDRRVE